MSIPKGVTVREAGSFELDVERPRNALERAAMCDDLATVKTIFSELLGISPDSKLDLSRCSCASLTCARGGRWCV